MEGEMSNLASLIRLLSFEACNDPDFRPNDRRAKTVKHTCHWSANELNNEEAKLSNGTKRRSNEAKRRSQAMKPKDEVKQRN